MPKPSFPATAEGLSENSGCKDVWGSLSNLEGMLASMRSLADAAELLAESNSSDPEACVRLSAIYTLNSLIVDQLKAARLEVEGAQRCASLGRR